jgi:hypothetical protein
MEKKQDTYDYNLIYEISSFLEHEVDFVDDDEAIWDLELNGRIRFDRKEKEVQFIDAEIDTKTYFAIVGICMSWDYKLGDYFVSI